MYCRWCLVARSIVVRCPVWIPSYQRFVKLVAYLRCIGNHAAQQTCRIKPTPLTHLTFHCYLIWNHCCSAKCHQQWSCGIFCRLEASAVNAVKRKLRWRSRQRLTRRCRPNTYVPSSRTWNFLILQLPYDNVTLFLYCDLPTQEKKQREKSPKPRKI